MVTLALQTVIFHPFLLSIVEGRFKKQLDIKRLYPRSFMSIMYANNTFHTYGVMNVNQKHLRMQMMEQVHTSKQHAFVFHLGWNAWGTCSSHLAFIWQKDRWWTKKKRQKRCWKSFEMLKYLSYAVNWSEWISSLVCFASLSCDKEVSEIHLNLWHRSLLLINGCRFLKAGDCA